MRLKTTMPEEVLNDLLGFKGMKIIQRPDMMNFSLDSILLSDFVKPTQKTKHILDIGTGFAPIPLFLSTKTKAKIIGVELQEAVVKIAKKNVALNNLTDQITIIHDDIKALRNTYPPSTFDAITVNPPFFKVAPDSKLNNNDYKTIARHEVTLNLDIIMQEASYLMKNKGKLYLVHRAERLSEIIVKMHQYNFRLKRLKMVYAKKGDSAMMVLLEASYHGPEGLKVLEPLYIHNANGSYTDVAQKIFNNERVE